jgi:hypothetical protein
MHLVDTLGSCCMAGKQLDGRLIQRSVYDHQSRCIKVHRCMLFLQSIFDFCSTCGLIKLSTNLFFLISPVKDFIKEIMLSIMISSMALALVSLVSVQAFVIPNYAGKSIKL